METKFNWFSAEGNQAVKSIFSFERPHSDSKISNPSGAHRDHLALGFSSDSEPLCSLVVINETKAQESLAWIATYTPEAFPLSQSIRVLGLNDFHILDELKTAGKTLPREPIWPSIILGEMLSQGQPGVTPDKAPISRAFSTFSFVQARCSLLYDEAKIANQHCIERLRQIENNPLFVQRPLSVDELAKIWSFAGDGLNQSNDARLVIDTVMAALESEIRGQNNPTHPDYLEFGLSISAIATGPLEQRIVEFERVTERLIHACNGNRELWSRAPLHLAAFTFMVGGGTSHLHLMNDFGRTFPGVYAWIGLFAALSGQKFWDSRWLRATSAVERLLRSSFEVQDPPTFDLCWIEYEWISKQKEPLAWISELPQLATQLLSVEIYPGVVCQMRILDRTGQATHLKDNSKQVKDKLEKSSHLIRQEQRAQNTLLNGITDAMRTLQAALTAASGTETSEDVQRTLFDTTPSDSQNVPSTKKKRAKKKSRKKS